jgi:hypothetical protein
MQRALVIALALAAAIVGAAASAPAGTPGLAAQFARPDQTVEYHFMIDAADLTEQELEKTLQAKVIVPMKSIAEIGQPEYSISSDISTPWPPRRKRRGSRPGSFRRRNDS